MGKPKHLRQLNLQLPSGSHPIFIGAGLSSYAHQLLSSIQGNQVFIITNTIVAPLYLEPLEVLLSDYQVNTLVLEDGEEYKNQSSLFLIYEKLISAHHHRDTTIIALGGGVIGDIAGFAAATYQRGVKFIQLPTSLLAQVDAAIGGKTAINHPLGKNMIGTFYSPHAVFMDVDTLKTLPGRELKAGMAEIIKYALLVGGDFLIFLTKLLQLDNTIEDTFTSTPSSLWMDLIRQCCEIKIRWVEQDPFEKGSRALLNLGHTIGHALEAITKYQKWLHGEAVGIGLYCAALLSQECGQLNEQELNIVDNLLKVADLPRRIPKEIDLQDLMVFIQKDKKIKNNTLRFVLIKTLGDCYVDDNISPARLHQVLLKAVEGDSE